MTPGMPLIKPEPVAIDLPEGGSKEFIISKFDAISGRAIVTQYPTSGIPQLGEYSTNEEIMIRMMAFVEVPVEGAPAIRLSTRELIKNHVPDWETLMRLEWAVMEYNCSFFANGKVSSFLEGLSETVPELILSMLTDLLQRLSPNDKPPSENSEPSTP